jgi:hypothetical protein
MDLLSVQFMEKDRLAAVAAHGVLTAQGSQMRIERIEMNLLGPESKTYLGTAPINLSIKSVLMSRDTETVAVRVVGENDVPWRIWRRDQRSNDISLDANPGNVSEGALSWDGNQLILLQKNGNRVYQWGTWFAGIRLPWRG